MAWWRRVHIWLDRLYRRRVMIPDEVWREVVGEFDILRTLTSTDQSRLRELVGRFLFRKTISGAGGLKVDDHIRITIGAVACLLVLELDLDGYDGWVEVIVYPGSFVVDRTVRDEIGVEHRQRQVLDGESWGDGPVILSWEEARPPHGAAVIIHEFAHKLDMLNGPADGFPPLHRDMNVEDWTASFTLAYQSLQRELEALKDTWMDPYAAEGPAEFFAVASEDFFIRPAGLARHYPEVYEQLSGFYRQNPLSRI